MWVLAARAASLEFPLKGRGSHEGRTTLSRNVGFAEGKRVLHFEELHSAPNFLIILEYHGAEQVEQVSTLLRVPLRCDLLTERPDKAHVVQDTAPRADFGSFIMRQMAGARPIREFPMA
jgi:hypothetical protein